MHEVQAQLSNETGMAFRRLLDIFGQNISLHDPRPWNFDNDYADNARAY
jgi:hypothetical protein